MARTPGIGLLCSLSVCNFQLLFLNSLLNTKIMAWDIHGQPLKRGYCEVHSWVAEEYPCSLCLIEDQKREFQQQREKEMHQHRNTTHDLHQFIEYLRSQPFEGWSEDSKNGYLTALKTIEENIH